MTLNISFSPEEINQSARFIGETFSLGSKPYATGRGKRLWKEVFTNKEDEDAANKMIHRCKHVFSHGLKSDFVVTAEELSIFMNLINYCQML